MVSGVVARLFCFVGLHDWKQEHAEVNRRCPHLICAVCGAEGWRWKARD